MHNGLLLGNVTFDRLNKHWTFFPDWEISQLRLDDIQNFLTKLVEEEPGRGYEADRISMVIPHLYGFYVSDVSRTLIQIQVYVAEEYSEQEEQELLLVMEERRNYFS